MILAIDHGNVHRRVTQGSRCPQSPETSADDYNTWHYGGRVIRSSLNAFWRTQGISISNSGVFSVLYFCHVSNLTKVFHILITVIAYSKKAKVTNFNHHESRCIPRRGGRGVDEVWGRLRR